MPFSKFFKTLIKGLIIAAILSICAFVLIWNGKILQVPSKQEIKSYKLPVASEIYSADSVLLGKYYLENRRNVTFEEIPDSLIKCLIATEDQRFFAHRGVDIIGLIRVGFKTFLLDENSGGGSTITQQLVKNIYPRKTFNTNSLLFHKIREWFTAMKFERLYTKQQILAYYLNTVPFGHNKFGIYTAAEYYFDKTPEELEIHEMATLVGLLKGTSIYDPERNPERSFERRNLVLANMFAHGHLSQEALQKESRKEIQLVCKTLKDQFIAPYFLQHIKSEIEEILASKYGKGSYDLHTEGLKIYTTLNAKVQSHAENALKHHLEELQKQFNTDWTNARWQKEKEKLIQLIKLKRYPGYKKLCAALANNEQLNPKMDSLLREIKRDLTQLQAGFSCIKNTGEVLAWVGGKDFWHSQYDHVKSTRQVGSAFKPIVYVTAVDQGVNICNYFKNDQQSYSDFDDWQPRNANNSYHGEYTMKGALTYSVNVISVQMLFRAGLSDVLNVANQMGISRDIPQVPSISLGTPDISLYEMVDAYTCFANYGKRVDSRYLTSIVNAAGKPIYMHEEKEHKTLFTEDVAAVMTNMMESVVNVGTSRQIRTKYKLQGAIAGKTGTSQKQSDGWFIGYTPQITAGAWVGADNPEIHFRSLSKGAGAKTALPIWAKFALNLQNDPDCAFLLEGAFKSPSKNSLRCLNQPLYREVEIITTPEEKTVEVDEDVLL